MRRLSAYFGFSVKEKASAKISKTDNTTRSHLKKGGKKEKEKLKANVGGFIFNFLKGEENGRAEKDLYRKFRLRCH